MGKVTFEQHAAYCTARIAIQSPDGTEESTGTGFFYGAPLNDGTGRFIILLISNKHVFSDPKGTLAVNLNKKIDNNTPKLGDLITIRDVDFSKIYYSHPDSDVDLACVNYSVISKADTFYKNLSDDFIKPIDYDKVVPGHNVMFIGYPHDYYDQINNLPLIRQGAIASLPTIDFNGKGQIVIDAQVFPGSSGSPVFVRYDGHALLLGVISETIVLNSQLETIPTNRSHTVEVEQTLGLGLIIKQKHVIELIDHAVSEFLSMEKN